MPKLAQVRKVAPGFEPGSLVQFHRVQLLPSLGLKVLMSEVRELGCTTSGAPSSPAVVVLRGGQAIPLFIRHSSLSKNTSAPWSHGAPTGRGGGEPQLERGFWF